jgi:hypothetical protein
VGDDVVRNCFGMSRAAGVLVVAYESLYSGNGMAYVDDISRPKGIGLPGGEFFEEFLPRHAAPRVGRSPGQEYATNKLLKVLRAGRNGSRAELARPLAFRSA